LKHAFPADVTFKLKLRLSKEPGGWVHGRMANPSVSFEESGSNTVMTVAAEPVKVPAVGAVEYVSGCQVWKGNNGILIAKAKKNPPIIQ
jgi:hypothetical protein